MYHVTLSSNVPSILRKGLIPQIGARAKAFAEPGKGIYLFKTLEDVENALMNWLGDEFEDEEITVLDVTVPNDATFAKSTAEYEVVVTSPIPPRNIRVTNDNTGKTASNIYVTIPLSAAVTVIEGVGARAVKTAISLPELVRQTNSFSKKYRPGCSPRLLDSNPKALLLHYNVKCNKDDSDPAGHDVRVQFDVSKIEESQQAKDLDIQVSCSCPAFLYWGAQWNLHQRDGLLGPARPKLQAPTERLDLRGNYVICKHCHAVFERILPSVQHNIVNILRKREMEKKKDELDKTPERLQKEQERMRHRKDKEKIRKTKDQEVKQKLLDALRGEEEARLLHEQELDEEDTGEVERDEPATGEVERDEPATGEHDHEHNHESPSPKVEPQEQTKAPEQTELDDISDLTSQEEEKIEQLHKENKPHVHKGLPYDEEEEHEGWAPNEDESKDKLSSKRASVDEPGLLWRAPEDNARHDYQPSWDYEPRVDGDPELAKLAVHVAQGIYRRTKQPFELWDVDLTEYGAVAMYIDGTCGYPVVLIDLEAHSDYPMGIGKSIDHELKHAIQDADGREYNEDEAEDDF